MTPVSQLIWRNLSRLESAPEERLLLVIPPADDLALQLASHGHDADLLNHSFGCHRRFEASGLHTSFGLLPEESGTWSRIVLFQPREKALLDMMICLCRSVLKPGGRLWLAGENRAGIKSCGKRLALYFSQHEKLDSARHCTLFSASDPIDIAFDLDAHFTQWTFDAAGRMLSMCSLPGVFAHGRLDPGTRLLIETLTGDDLDVGISGPVLDFACGAGALGLAMAATRPGLALTLLDDSALALESARRSVAANGTEATLIASDGLAELIRDGQERFDWIVSNPPFHQGVRQDTAVSFHFIRDCPRLLAKGGRLCLVANVHLPYRRWLEELFSHVQVISADPEYNVWLASGAKV